MTEKETITNIIHGQDPATKIILEVAEKLRTLPTTTAETYNLCSADIYNFSQELVNRRQDMISAEKSGQIDKKQRNSQTPKLLMDAAEKWLVRHYEDKHEVRDMICRILLGIPYIQYRAKYESEQYEDQ